MMASRDYYRDMSRRLSRVMDDIGVNEEVVMNSRRIRLIEETVISLHKKLFHFNTTHYFFGSRTEGTTTEGLVSDVDCLEVIEDYNLLQDLNDWVNGKINLLMIQDERFPGYCKLQLLKADGPYPEDVFPCDKLIKFDEAGRVILLHLLFDEKKERHGPAESFFIGKYPFPNDFVRSIYCKTWPNGYKKWSTHPRKGTWPTPEMISYMENSGCFVVQVAHRLDEKTNESWRISTSLAERCLMFSLNITQIRCYILIKMIIKTFIDPVIPDVISSYICKNLLFYCVENTRSDFWQESNLLRCVNQVLLNMLEAIRCMNCPSYFNESINLFLGKVNTENKIVLLCLIWKVLISEGDFLAKIRYDNINESMDNDHETYYQRNDCSSAVKNRYRNIFSNTLSLYKCFGDTSVILMQRGVLSQRDLMSLQITMLLFALQGPFQYVSATILFPFLCSHLATLKANESILNGEMLSHRTSLLYEISRESDATSSSLKYASYLYCTGQFERALSVILEVLGRLTADFFPVCQCDPLNRIYFNVDPSIQFISPSLVSMCVVFSAAERECCQRELQFEMYRFTEQEKLQRDDDYGLDNWMNLACIDSVSYFSFLWYMTCRHMGHRDLQLQALGLLEKLSSFDRDHRETVYNLLGQCYKYENRFAEAFECYCRSLRLKPTYNAARWHIVLLLYTLFQNK